MGRGGGGTGLGRRGSESSGARSGFPPVAAKVGRKVLLCSFWVPSWAFLAAI
jgi:hypothetical protein